MSLPATPPAEDATPMPDPKDELCAKCGYTYGGHVGNTGCVYSCWTPSGRYATRSGRSWPRQFSTKDCPEHGEACAGSDCCCRDKHPVGSNASPPSSPASATPTTEEMLCDRCDGCGWYEGGKHALQTTCEECGGTGVVAPPSVGAATPEPRLSNIEIPEVDNSAAGEAGAQEEPRDDETGETQAERDACFGPVAATYEELAEAYHAQLAHTDVVRALYQSRVAALESALLIAIEDRAKAEAERDALRAEVLTPHHRDLLAKALAASIDSYDVQYGTCAWRPSKVRAEIDRTRAAELLAALRPDGGGTT